MSIPPDIILIMVTSEVEREVAEMNTNLAHVDAEIEGGRLERSAEVFYKCYRTDTRKL